MRRMFEYHCSHCSATFRGPANHAECPACETESMAGQGVPVDSLARDAWGGSSHPLALFRSAKLLLTGIVSLLLCLLMILNPDFRDDPKHISINDVLRGLGAGAVGIVVIAFVLVGIRTNGRSS